MRAYRDQYAEIFGDSSVVLLAISRDRPEVLASWAAEERFPFRMLSDADETVGNALGTRSPRGPLYDYRGLFIVAPDGRIAYRVMPFREMDPTAYVELADAIRKIAGRD